MDKAPPTPFVHHAQAGQVVGIALVNGILNLVTLSWYRFWGNTRVRRLLWNHTTAWGDPFDYTGTGKELFLGFLVVFFLVLVPLILTGVAVNALATSGSPLAVFGAFGMQVAALFLAGAGLYRARRYRLSRTVWRGIRGGQQGSALRYGLMVLGAVFLAIITLGWAWPWAEMWLQRYKLANTTFGDCRFECTASSRATYNSFALLWLGGLALVLIGGLLAAASSDMWTPQDDLEGTLPLLAYGPWLLNLLALMLLAIPFVRYRAALYRTVAAGTSVAGANFSLNFGLWRFVWLGIGNWLLTTATLGLLAPLAAQRTVRFACSHLAVTAEPDFAVIAQGAPAEGRTGEGLAAMFDGAGAI